MSKISSRQAEVLHETAQMSENNGFLYQYQMILKTRTEEIINQAYQLEHSGGLDHVGGYLDRAKHLGNVMLIEAPLAFFTEVDVTESGEVGIILTAKKINSVTGEGIVGSEVQVGLIDGIGDTTHQPSEFESDYLPFAIDRVMAQEEAGLIFDSVN